MKFSREIKKKVTLSSQLYSREKNSILKKKRKKSVMTFIFIKYRLMMFLKRETARVSFLPLLLLTRSEASRLARARAREFRDREKRQSLFFLVCVFFFFFVCVCGPRESAKA